jgi:hypothetical protein
MEMGECMIKSQSLLISALVSLKLPPLLQKYEIIKYLI